MAEDLGDLRERDPGAGHLASQRVAEPVRPDDRHSRPRAGAAHDARDPIGSEWPDRRNSSQEHLTVHSALRAAPAQVGDDRLADVVRQREAVLVAALAPDHDLAGSPVDVLQAQAGDLAGPQSEAEQGEQDGVVPPALGSPSVTRTKQGTGGLLIDPHRQ